MAVSRVPLASSSPRSLPFSIENILQGQSRTPIGSSSSAFRRTVKNGGFRPAEERFSLPLCVEGFDATDASKERSPVSNSHAEKWLEDQYPHLLSGKRMKSRFTERQVTVLEHVFRSKPYIMGRERKALAKQVGLSELQVKTWFQNKRQKYRRLISRDVPDSERWKRADCGTPEHGSETVEEDGSH